MTNKTRAIVDANRALRAENRELWARNEELASGAEEMRELYNALIMQLVKEAGGSVKLAMTDVKELTKRCELLVKYNADDGGMTLTVRERVANDGT